MLLQWPSLRASQAFQQLCVCNRILRDLSLLPSSMFQSHPRPSRAHVNSKPLFRQSVKTKQHSSSFFHSIVPIWNSLPDQVVTCSSQLGFKRILLICMFINFIFFLFLYLFFFFVSLFSTIVLLICLLLFCVWITFTIAIIASWLLHMHWH